jgi:hypothetical protein
MHRGYSAACSKIGINLDFGTTRVHLFLQFGKHSDEFRGMSAAREIQPISFARISPDER